MDREARDPRDANDFASGNRMAIVKRRVDDALVVHQYFHANLWDHLRWLEIQVISNKESEMINGLVSRHDLAAVAVKFPALTSLIAASGSAKNGGCLHTLPQFEEAISGAVAKLVVKENELRASVGDDALDRPPMDHLEWIIGDRNGS